MPRTIVIAGTHSGCGKTTASLALMAALRRRGLRVQAFKAGPDFIDPGHHERVTARPSHNLDGWMMGREGVMDVFNRHAADADVAVVEGVMGLFDGFSGTDEEGSTAQLAKWLDAPVVLVVDARSMARSAAALVKGYAEFDPALRVAGVLFNRVGSDNHRGLIEDAMLGVPGVEALGFLARDEGLALPSRHLGLVTADDHALDAEAVARLTAWMEAGCNVGRVADLAPDTPCATVKDWPEYAAGNGDGHDPATPGGQAAAVANADHITRAKGNTAVAPPTSAGESAGGTDGTAPANTAADATTAEPICIGVARDRAFCFYYHENLRLLEAAGAELVFFSPLEDAAPPPELDGLYLGGGYPELHARELAANAPMLAGVRALCAAGRPVYAECGGFMYLMQSLTDARGTEHAMAGVLPVRAAMGERFRALGYREAVITEATFFGPAWTMLRGHEFHYSSITGMDEVDAVYKVRDRKGWTSLREGYRAGNTLGTYIHSHFASNPDAARSFVAACREARG